MEDNTNQLSSPMMCKKNCGFFGNASCDGFCSKCYKDHVKKQNTGSAAGRVTPTGLQAPSSTTTTDKALLNLEAQVANPSSSMAPPTQSIPIPSRQQSKVTDNDFDAVGMSVPVDLASAMPLSATPSSSADMACSVDESVIGSSVGAEKKKRTRCCVDTCKRKVGLTGFDCRCGGLYCWEHRYSDKHECKFDYKELGQDQIRKNNPVVVGEKIQKI